MGVAGGGEEEGIEAVSSVFVPPPRLRRWDISLLIVNLAVFCYNQVEVMFLKSSDSDISKIFFMFQAKHLFY